MFICLFLSLYFCIADLHAAKNVTLMCPGVFVISEASMIFCSATKPLQLSYLAFNHFGAKTCLLSQRLATFGAKLASHL